MTRKPRPLVLAAVAILAVVVGGGVLIWLASREPNTLDLNRRLIGHWLCGTNQAVGGALVTTNVTRASNSTTSALHFNGVTSRASIADAPEFALRAGSDFSVASWIRPENSPFNSFGVMSIVEKRKVGGITSAIGLSLHLEYGFLATQISPAQGFRLTKADLLSPAQWLLAWKNRRALAPVNRFISTNPPLCDGKFHHVALTVHRRSREGGKLYVDGEVVLTFDPTRLGGSLANKEAVLIGTHPDPSLQCGFKGDIDDVRLYSRALSHREVERLLNPPR